MNLYKRLKPEHRDSINANSKLYPNTTESLIIQLKSNDYFTNVRYGSAMEVNSICNLNFFSDAFKDIP
jgi:hypothetical protein